MIWWSRIEEVRRNGQNEHKHMSTTPEEVRRNA